MARGKWIIAVGIMGPLALSLPFLTSSGRAKEQR